jgi:hypothetical protein
VDPAWDGAGTSPAGEEDSWAKEGHRPEKNVSSRKKSPVRNTKNLSNQFTRAEGVGIGLPGTSLKRYKWFLHHSADGMNEEVNFVPCI